MNLDNTWNRLQTLAEYVDDTEDYIKFDIDTKRNQFIEVLSYFIAGTCGCCGFVRLRSLFGGMRRMSCAKRVLDRPDEARRLHRLRCFELAPDSLYICPPCSTGC